MTFFTIQQKTTKIASLTKRKGQIVHEQLQFISAQKANYNCDFENAKLENLIAK